MNFNDYFKQVLDTTYDEWNTISCWGYGAGPSYLNRFEVWNTGNGEFHNIEIDSHGMIAICKNNISISIAWGLKHNDDFSETWANNFPDKHARSSYLDFFCNGVLIHREIMVSVDGGRCYLPLPQRDIDSKTYEVKRHFISKQKSDFIKMINELESSSDQYEYYLDSAGIELIEEDWF